ncbi:hypothetical protein, partial [Thiolapillus sp.]|uniref:hypothetical protein n=1 Tax=Thiolapillus sp. TaxID=2017437 RepID=UPI003AF8FD1B
MKIIWGDEAEVGVGGENTSAPNQVCLRPRDRFWDIPVPKIDSAFDNLFVPQPSWSPSTTQQLRKLVAAPYLAPNDWTPRLDAYFASPLALCARRVSSAASRLLGSTSLRFALHGWQRLIPADAGTSGISNAWPRIFTTKPVVNLWPGKSPWPTWSST